MKLTSMKQKWSDHAKAPLKQADDEYYPSLHLDEALLDKLGIETHRVGTDLHMVAKVRVSSVHESKSGSRSMSLEIIEASIAKPSDDGDKAAVLFPNARK